MQRFLLIVFAISVSLGNSLQAGTFRVATSRDIRPTKARVQAARFLNRATFGPTLAEIESLSQQIVARGEKRALEAWIDAQFELPVEDHHSFIKQKMADDGFTPDGGIVNRLRYRDHAFWHHAIAADDQLRQRVAWALAQIYVINKDGANTFNQTQADASGEAAWLGVVNYNDMLLRNAFGNYRTLLRDVSLHPIMGQFLTHLGNRKQDPLTGRFPDENFAREVMQLFSIGLYELKNDGSIRRKKGELVPAYDNDDIREFSRVFTGLTFQAGAGVPQTFRNLINYHAPMAMVEEEHDTEAKTLLNGQVLPAGQSGLQDIDDAMDNLTNHPNTGPFIARLLIQRLVKSNPSKGYISRVARKFANNGKRVRGDMRAVVKAILMDQEALGAHVFRQVRLPDRSRGLRVTAKGTEHSRLREPAVRYVQMFRAFKAESNHPTGMMMIPSWQDVGQAPYQSPSVFNFYLPDYQPQGDLIGYKASRNIPNGSLFAPEFQILTTVAATRFPNFLLRTIRQGQMRYTADGFDAEINLNFDDQIALADDPVALLDQLDLLLCNGTLSDEAKTSIAEAIEEETDDLNVRARAAVIAVIISPDCAVSY